MEENKPDYADDEQWQVKVDLLKALAFVLVPDTDERRVLNFAYLLENSRNYRDLLKGSTADHVGIEEVEHYLAIVD